MQAMKCEMCGSSELIKKDDIFVCEYCGCKYTKEEAKKLLVEVSGTVKLDESEKFNNYIKLANNSIKSGDAFNAKKYADMALEINVEKSVAWIAKMKAFNLMSTIKDLKIINIIECGENAIKYKEIDDIDNLIYNFWFNKCITILNNSYVALNSGTLITKQSNGYTDYSNEINFIDLHNKATNQAISLISSIPNLYFASNFELFNNLPNVIDLYNNISIKLNMRQKYVNKYTHNNLLSRENISNKLSTKVMQIQNIINFKNTKTTNDYMNEWLNNDKE